MPYLYFAAPLLNRYYRCNALLCQSILPDFLFSFLSFCIYVVYFRQKWYNYPNF